MNTPPPTARPSKPRPDFPLFPHPNGQWAKKVGGKPYYFGTWASDPTGEQALALWLKQKDLIRAGGTVGTDVAMVVRRWPELPLAIRAGIVAMVEAYERVEGGEE